MTLLTREDISKMPDPQWLIHRVLPAGTVNMIYGATNKGKSFCAVDMACCIATGKKWAGRPVQQGPVVYVAGEAANGYKLRLPAWEKQHGVDRVSDFYLREERVTLWHDDQDTAQDFIDEIVGEQIHPLLIVFDPLVTCLGGADENDNGHMREVLNRAEDIVRELRTTVLLIHHMPSSGTKARGAQALADGVSMQGYFTSVGDPVTRGVLTCKKQREDERFEPISRAVHRVTLGPGRVSLSLADEYKTGPREQTQPRVTWDQIQSFMETEGEPVTPAMVGKVFNISRQAARGHLTRNAVPVGDGAYKLSDIVAKVA